MRMIIALDKICLTMIVLLSFSVGYKTGLTAAELKFSMNGKEK